jgi:hypothetical protein
LKVSRYFSVKYPCKSGSLSPVTVLKITLLSRQAFRLLP